MHRQTNNLTDKQTPQKHNFLVEAKINRNKKLKIIENGTVDHITFLYPEYYPVISPNLITSSLFSLGHIKNYIGMLSLVFE